MRKPSGRTYGEMSWLRAVLCSAALLGLVVGLATALGVLQPSAAVAQQPPAGGGDEFDPGAAPPAGGAPAAGGGDGQAAGGAPAAPGTAPKKKKNLLQWVGEALGIQFSVIFLALSFSAVALFVMNLLAARRDNIVPIALVESFEAHLNEKRYQEAYELAKSDESFLGHVLSAGLAKLRDGYEKAIEAMQEVGEEENMKLEHKLSYLALIGTISPMAGLYGTVWGMIAAFDTLATTGGGAPDPEVLAGNISTALFTTLLGLMIAIPVIAAYNILRNRVQRLVLEVGILSEGLMSRFENVGGAKKA
jgi:biopolymer transport protein ExbB